MLKADGSVRANSTKLAEKGNDQQTFRPPYPLSDFGIRHLALRLILATYVSVSGTLRAQNFVIDRATL